MRRWRTFAAAIRSTAEALARTLRLAAVALAALIIPALAIPARAADRPVLDGLAQVQSDASLRIEGRTVRLYGVYIPDVDGATCSRIIRPVRCGSRSALFLEQQVTGFVRCEIIRQTSDGVLEGLCSVQGRDLFGPRTDLGSVMVSQGWALAGDDAPARYRALERLASSREVGLWGNKILNFR